MPHKHPAHSAPETITITEIFEGPYGSGKGTHGKLRVERLQASGISAVYIETSGLLRKSTNPLVTLPMSRRESVPLDIVCHEVESALVDCHSRGVQRVILDGFPRNFPNTGMRQFDCFGDMVRRHGLNVVVARFRAKFDFCDARIQGRVDDFIRLGNPPRKEDADVEIRHRGLRHYFGTCRRVIRWFEDQKIPVLTVSLTDLEEPRESVAKRLDLALSGEAGKMQICPREFEQYGGRVPGGVASRYFRPRAQPLQVA